jgi:hypothetical protein
LNWRQGYVDCVISSAGKVNLLGDSMFDWRVTLVDTGI